MRHRPPERHKTLFENLFAWRTPPETIEAISQGISGVLANAARLLADVELLIGVERYATAAFLLATADEEMAKAYILLDACRLDFGSHESVLRALCRAFYSHIAKHAYNKVTRWEWFVSMAYAKEIWDNDMIRWWPADPESGQPEMPHDTYFAREVPLYVDFEEYAGGWFVPDANERKYIFEDVLGASALLRSRHALDRL